MATNSAKVYSELEIEPIGVQGHDSAQSRIAPLESFLPYQLSVIASRVSRGLARLYAVRFDLTVPEWRIMTVLGRFPGVSANEVRVLEGLLGKIESGVAAIVNEGFGLSCGMADGNGTRGRYNRH